MKPHLPKDLERFVQAKVGSGRFTSSDEAIAEAVRLPRQREEAEEARVLEGIRQGLEDMRAGRGRPAEEVFAEIRREFDLSEAVQDVLSSPEGAAVNSQGRKPLDAE